MQKFLERYSIWFSTVMGLGVIAFMVTNRAQMPMTQRLVAMCFVAVSLHEWEEMRLPGGFMDMVLNGIGLKLKNVGSAKLALFVVEMVTTFTPLFFPKLIWMCAGPMLLGFVEAVAHLAATRMNKGKRFYSPGMVTALLVMLPLSVYGVMFAAQNALMPGVYWLYAVLWLLVPVVIAQRYVVTANGMHYGEFLGNARSALFGKAK